MTTFGKFRLRENPLGVALVVSCCAAALSYLLPPAYSATAVGLWFLVATYALTLREPPSAGPTNAADSSANSSTNSSTNSVADPAADPVDPASPEADSAARWGLSLGGLLDREPLSGPRLARATLRALGYAAALALITLPPFWLGFVFWYGAEGAFTPTVDWRLLDEALGQLLVIALPEEAFFRGYLQTSLEERWPPRHRVLGAPLGWAVVVTSAVFALGHLATVPEPARLAVFFPSLAFGWLRARTGGIGAGVLYHASCNLFASFLGRGYGLLP
jgi:membrane protease YdiL (CAAX protease family)